MRDLAPLREGEPARKGRGYRAVVKDDKTGQQITITSAEPIAAYALDDEARKWWQDADGERRPDAVVLARASAHSYVIFVELTHSMRPRTHRRDPRPRDPALRKMEQLQSAIDHFHPQGRGGGERTHGDEHHDRWAAGEDEPDPLPAKEHRVGGIVLSFHLEARSLPLMTQMGGRTVKRVVWSPVPSSRQQAEITLEQLLGQFGWFP